MYVQECKERTSKGVTQSLSRTEQKELEDNTCISDPRSCLWRPTSSPTPPTAAPSGSDEVDLLYRDACLPGTSTGIVVSGIRGAPQAPRQSSSHTGHQQEKVGRAKERRVKTGLKI
ncbi:hypothetical protein PoB_004721500 [Plakobranchus ocellatus]|uniref:Uncharacterized protein n=1 Tax=Plakobranchus ocellatus TaxID=259542 RepID=A0AAV4BJL8_9GAST|nr:hypothetical protein PoB_004721500 [Plakobranchus ocellatus]